MAIVLSGTTNDILVNGVSVATDAEVSSAVAPKANTADVNTQLSLKANTADLKEIGVGQTWQDMTASRSAGVTYTNTTGKPIMIAIQAINITTAAGVDIVVTVGGLIHHFGFANASLAANNAATSGVLIVPNNVTYSFTVTNMTYQHCYELR